MAARPTWLRPLLVAAVAVGLVFSAAVVWQSTAAAFTASTDNPGNSWQTGSVVLADNDGAAALFEGPLDSDLRPLSTRSRCIRVDYTGSLPASIRLYVTTPASGAVTLDPYLVMSIEQGQDVPSGTTVAPDCTGGFTSTSAPTFVYNTAVASDPASDQTRTMTTLKAAAHDYSTGLSVGTAVVQGTSLTFKITYSVLDDNRAQNARSTAGFVWEARNA